MSEDLDLDPDLFDEEFDFDDDDIEELDLDEEDLEDLEDAFLEDCTCGTECTC